MYYRVFKQVWHSQKEGWGSFCLSYSAFLKLNLQYTYFSWILEKYLPVAYSQSNGMIAEKEVSGEKVVKKL